MTSKKKKKKQKGTQANESTKQTSSSASKPPSEESLRKLEIAAKIFHISNQCYKAKIFLKAVDGYTEVIRQIFGLGIENPKPVLMTLFLNRAITNLQLKKWKLIVEEDCKYVLQLDPNCAKALVLKGIAHLSLGDFEECRNDFRKLPKNEDMKKHLERILKIFHEKRTIDLNFLPEWKMLQIEEEVSPFPPLHALGLDSKTTSEKSSVPMSDLPLLIPIGEDDFGNSLDDTIEMNGRKNYQEKAMEEKKKGNTAFTNGDYFAALAHYTKAIQLDPREAIFFSNRALVYLKLNRFHECITDCTASLERKESIKAYAHRGSARAALLDYMTAAIDYRKALKFESRNQHCLVELEKCLVQLEQQYRRKLEVEPKNEKVKNSLDNVRDDLKSIASRIDPRPTQTNKMQFNLYIKKLK